MIVPVIVRARVNVHVQVYDIEKCQFVSESRHHNRAVDTGLDQIRDYLFGNTPVAITHGAVGTSNAAATGADVMLGAEVFRDVIAAKVKGNQSLTVQFVLGSTHANGQTLQEAGLFNHPSAGVMYARVVTAPVNKTDLLSVLYTWTLSWSADV